MEFKRPELVRDWPAAAKSIALGLAKIKYGKPIGAVENLVDGVGKLRRRPEESSQATAWSFVANCVATAAHDLMTEPRMRCQLDEGERSEAIRPLIEAIPDHGELLPVHIVNLSLLEAMCGCYSALPEVVKAMAPEAPYSESEALSRFKDALAVSVSKVTSQNAERYVPITGLLRGETAEATVRNLAWERHSAWIRSQFHATPIFSPDETETTPLSHVYLELRARRNTRHDVKGEDGRQVGFYTSAELGMLGSMVQEWLESSEKRDAIRIVAGGPGCGKSSFARAFASVQLQNPEWNVLFVRLQHLRGQGTLRERVFRYLKDRHGWGAPAVCEGFPDNPFDWHGESNKKLLVVFDGLDELTAVDEEATRLAQQFVNDTRHLLGDLNAAGNTARALILGRTTAVEDMRDRADLPLDAVLHVAPIRPLDVRDLGLQVGSVPSGEISSKEELIHDPGQLASIDQRSTYWDRWCTIKGIAECSPPPALTDERMKDLNVEPLLLHLLIVSGFVADRWEEAAENRNVVYREIFKKIFARNSDKGLEAYRGLTEDDFFDLMETFGLAAFRGNGRTGTNEDFLKLRACYAPEKFDAFEHRSDTDLRAVALLTHAQHDVEGAGFEFIHKSFGEYLAARSILGAAKRISGELRKARAPLQRLRRAEDWAYLFNTAEMTEPVVRFLKDEARLWSPDAALEVRGQLEGLLNWTLYNGMPVHRIDDAQNASFQSLMDRQRCSETALLGAVTSLALCEPQNAERMSHLVKLPAFKNDKAAAFRMIQRLVINGSGIRPASGLCARLSIEGGEFLSADLSSVDLSGANLRGAELSSAYLTEANLDEADLSGASLCGAEMNWTSLYRANLSGTDLSGADLRWADLSGATIQSTNLDRCVFGSTRARFVDFTESRNMSQEQVNCMFGVRSGLGQTRLPSHLTAPNFWHDAEDAEVDSPVLVDAYRAAFHAWLASERNVE